MSGRIIAAGFALGFVVFAWQAGAGVKSVVSAGPVHHAASTALPAVITLSTAWGNVTCKLVHASYSCTTPPMAKSPVSPAVYTVGAR